MSTNRILMQHGNLDIHIQRHRRQVDVAAELYIKGPEVRMDAEVAPQLVNFMEDFSLIVAFLALSLSL